MTQRTRLDVETSDLIGGGWLPSVSQAFPGCCRYQFDVVDSGCQVTYAGEALLVDQATCFKFLPVGCASGDDDANKSHPGPSCLQNLFMIVSVTATMIARLNTALVLAALTTLSLGITHPALRIRAGSPRAPVPGRSPVYYNNDPSNDLFQIQRLVMNPNPCTL